MTIVTASPTRAARGTSVRRARGGLLIVGGGFAGASLARMRGRAGATIVSPENFMLYTPLLPDVAAGTVEPRHVVMPLRQMCPHADLMLGRAVALDRPAGMLRVETAAGELVDVGYDRLVLASGSRPRMLPIPGLAEHGVAFKTIEEAVFLRNLVLRRLDEADAAPPERRDRDLTFVFVGGGYAGVEAVAQMHDLVRHAVRHHPRLRSAPQRWMLVDAAPRILAGAGARLGEYAARQLARRGIEIHTGTSLVSAVDGHVVLSNGLEVDAATLVWSAGVQADGLAPRLGLPVDSGGRVPVDPWLRVLGCDDVYALGDCATVPNAAQAGAPDPPTCQHALRQARRLARNLRGQDAARRERPYGYRTRGRMAVIGRRRAIAEIGGVRLKGVPAWLIARGYHLSRLPLRRRRLRVAADWLVASVFPRDIAHLESLGHVTWGPR